MLSAAQRFLMPRQASLGPGGDANQSSFEAGEYLWAAGVVARGQLDPLDIAAMQLLDADGMRALAEGAPAFIDDRPARLSRTITLVDTGSDFLARAPGVRYTTYDREIDALIAGALSPPGAAFTGVPAEAAAEIEARRARGVIARPRLPR